MRDEKLLAEFDPFGIFDWEAARLEEFFAGLDPAGWERPSRCAGWSVKDVLGHLAGEELYNHACLDDDLGSFAAVLDRAGVSGYEEFNEWCVRERRGVPAGEVLAEWREASAETRRRMRELGRDATLRTAAGPYPVGLQTFHYASEFATHADDVGVPVSAEEAPERTRWRVAVGRFALGEADSPARVEVSGEEVRVEADGARGALTPAEFVEATVGRLPGDDQVDGRIRAALRCLA
ncbi:maleylpyruvate isomerase family mycothiol-dependent enzyme [Streptosporangiaceae bacterium NEAU-GS5]|nr:maleylpyruvate isomerase family mycothiol-dependent enzyme [Streptosporangiaceae bacterium NEAU-GS5]